MDISVVDIGAVPGLIESPLPEGGGFFIDAVHEAGLVHRDFKPENVMITRAGRVVVMDFGIAKSVEAETGTIIGTPAWWASTTAGR